jgi:hypothetical protein
LTSFQGVQKESRGKKIRTAAWGNLPGKEFVIELEHSLIPRDTSGSACEENTGSAFLHSCQPLNPATIKYTGVFEANHHVEKR